MASTLDSTAVFRARLDALGFTDAEKAVLAANNWDTFGNFSFSCNYVPGAADEAPLVAVGATVFTADPPPAGRMALLRRLFYESFTLMSADLRARAERDDDSAPKKLPVAEREARFTRLSTRLTGLVLKDDLEPSHALIDFCSQMQEDNVLRYVAWDTCTTRAQELAGVKKEAVWKPDPQGVVRLVRTDRLAPADTGTDLKISRALQRRGLAFDLAELLRYEDHQVWVELVLQHYGRAPPDGYAKLTVDQLVKADMTLFRKMADFTRTGIQRRPDGTYPLTAAITAAASSTDVMFLLMPLPGVPPRAERQQHARPQGSEPEAKRHKGSRGSGKGKSQGKGRVSTGRLPIALKGMASADPSGRRICFTFNIVGKCGQGGPSCEKGLHVCCRPGCFGEHPLTQCTK